LCRLLLHRPPAAEIEASYTPDVIQEEFPNRLLPTGAVRDLDTLREAGSKGRQVIAAQTIEIVNAVSSVNALFWKQFGSARLRSASARSSLAID
jgi:hypothetical protein